MTYSLLLVEEEQVVDATLVVGQAGVLIHCVLRHAEVPVLLGRCCSKALVERRPFHLGVEEVGDVDWCDEQVLYRCTMVA